MIGTQNGVFLTLVSDHQIMHLLLRSEGNIHKRILALSTLSVVKIYNLILSFVTTKPHHESLPIQLCQLLTLSSISSLTSQARTSLKQ